MEKRGIEERWTEIDRDRQRWAEIDRDRQG